MIVDNEKFISENSWFAWSKHVLHQLEVDSKCLYEMKRELTEIKIELNSLKKDIYYRSGLWGAIGGALPATVALCIWFFKYYYTK